MKFGIFYEHQLPRPWEETSSFSYVQGVTDRRPEARR